MGSSSADTIFAAATGHGRAAICVIRVSGPATRQILETVAGGVPAARRLVLRNLKSAAGEHLDQGLVVWLPGPQSFTGEDQAELHIHGGLATRNAVVQALHGMEGCRAADPGEFTRRAFLNGRMDLSRAEGLGDLIDAETEAQRKQALRQLEGGLGQKVEAWREELLQILAGLEAALDFSDEEDVPDETEHKAGLRIGAVRHAIGDLLDRPSGERLREGFTVVLAGPPNAGKSTLLNAVAKREVAIVSPFAGTTRDLIEVRCDLGGLPVTFVDTAGLRDSAHPVEQEGVLRARERARSADLVLWLVPPDAPQDLVPVTGPDVITIATKHDIGPPHYPFDFAISAWTGDGIPALLDLLREKAENGVGHGDAVVTRERHRHALREAHASLGGALAQLDSEGPLELVAEDVRLAARAVGRISGRVDVEDVLDRLFSNFCIGK